MRADSKSRRAAMLVRQGKATQTQAAKLLGISRQAVSIHLRRWPQDGAQIFTNQTNQQQLIHHG